MGRLICRAAHVHFPSNQRGLNYLKLTRYDGARSLRLLAEYKRQLQTIEEKLRNIEDSPSIIRGLLEALLKFHNADRAYVIEYDADLMIGATTYEVCADGIISHASDMQYLQTEVFSRWMQQLQNNQPVLIPDVEAIKDESPEEYEIMHVQNITSVLATPFSKKYVTGFVGVDNPRSFASDPSFAFTMSYAVVAELNEIKLQAKVEQATKQLTKHQETDLYVSFFGGLEIKSAYGILSDDQITGDQCYQLLVYLLLHRKRVRPLRELADMLWPEDVITDPYKDVKNVVYRLKKFLALAGLEDLIIGSSGTFVINPKYIIHADFERFEEAHAKFFSDPSLEVKAVTFRAARSLYKGPLLPRVDHLHWMMPRISYYQGLYLQILKTLIQYEINEGMYPSAQRHTMSGLEIEPYDIDFKVAAVICMYAMNNRSLADNYYLKIEPDLTDPQRETIKSYQQAQSKLAADK